MNWYQYWYFANSYFFNNTVGWLNKGSRGFAIFLLLSHLPVYALYALPLLLVERCWGIDVCNKISFLILIAAVPCIHLAVFYPGSKRFNRWENRYRLCCTEVKNALVMGFSVICMLGCAFCLWGWKGLSE